MRTLTRIAVLVMLSISCTCGQDDDLFVLPEFDIFGLDTDDTFYKERAQVSSNAAPEELLRKLCDEYDLQLDNKKLDCQRIRVVPRTLQIDEHIIKKRQAEEPPLEGSGEPEDIASVNEAEAPPEGQDVPDAPAQEEAKVEPAASLGADVPLEEPAPKEPAPEEPAPEVPPPEEPAPEGPPAGEPAPEGPPAEEPAPEGPPAGEPAPEGPPAEKPAPEGPPAEEPAPEGPPAEETAPEVPSPEVPSPEEPPLEKPTPEEPAPEAPVPEEPVPETPTVEGTKVEEPVLNEGDKTDDGQLPVDEGAKADKAQSPEPPMNEVGTGQEIVPAITEISVEKQEAQLPVVKKGRVLKPDDTTGTKETEANSGGSGIETVHEHQSGNALIDGPGTDTLEGSVIAVKNMPPKENIQETSKADLPKSGESSEDTKQGRKDSKILVILLVAVVVIGCAAFAYNFIKKRKQKKSETSRTENGNATAQKTDKDAEHGTELKPLMRSAEEKPVVEYKDEKDKPKTVAAK